MKLSPLHRRLLPVYLSCFFEGCIFWYAIEKVFMVHIGFTPRLIAINVIVVLLVGTVFNIPGGILADRWSRKGTVILSIAALGLATLMLGLSHSVQQYVAASTLYGLYYALYDGSFGAMVYDTVIDETSLRDGFETCLGYATFIESIALVVGSLFGGFIGSKLGLSVAYFLSLPGCLISIFALTFFKEPRLHEKQLKLAITSQIRRSYMAVVHNRYLIWILITVVLSIVLTEFLSELDQLWPLALHLKLILYGPLNALLLLGYGLGGVIGGKLVKHSVFLILTAILGFVCICLLMVHSMPIIAIAQFGVILIYGALYTVTIGALHDQLPTSIRSGAASVVGMLSGVIFIPYALLFSSVAQHASVLVAARLLIPLAFCAGLGLIFILKLQGHRRSPTT